MTSQKYEIDEVELEDLRRGYEVFVREQIDTLKQQREKFKSARTDKIRSWSKLEAEKTHLLSQIQKHQTRVKNIEYQTSVCKFAMSRIGDDIKSINSKIKSLEKELQPIVEERKQQEDEDFIKDYIIDGIGGKKVDLVEDHEKRVKEEIKKNDETNEIDFGFNDIKKDIIQFHRINTQFNSTWEDDEEIKKLLEWNDKKEVEEEEEQEAFTYTSIRVSKKP